MVGYQETVAPRTRDRVRVQVRVRVQGFGFGFGVVGSEFGDLGCRIGRKSIESRV
jgi:hypothetical protein